MVVTILQHHFDSIVSSLEHELHTIDTLRTVLCRSPDKLSFTLTRYAGKLHSFDATRAVMAAKTQIVKVQMVVGAHFRHVRFSFWT